MFTKVDHIGIAVNSIDEALKFFRDALGLEVEGIEEVADQKVRIAFLPVGETHIELLEPTSPDSNVAKFLGEDVSGLTLTVAAGRCVDGIKRLIRAVELPRSLESLGVKKEDLPAIAERATWNVSVESNPRVLTLEVFKDILEKAYKGW